MGSLFLTFVSINLLNLLFLAVFRKKKKRQLCICSYYLSSLYFHVKFRTSICYVSLSVFFFFSFFIFYVFGCKEN